MLKKFQNYIEENKLIEEGVFTLVAASAGIDSTVLCHLFHRAKLPFAIAHCNFQLRFTASEADEQFAKNLAKQLKVPFYATRFDTEVYANVNKMGIQEAARKLRYDWLENILQTTAYQRIATAHHSNDNVETVLFHFAKGTGIRGLRGIPSKRGNIIRPILFASKKEMLAFAKKENIEFRVDETNLTDKYSRNRIRHKVIPVLEDIAPGFQKNAPKTIERMADVEALFYFAIEKIREEVVFVEGNEACFDLRKIREFPAPATVLYELLRPFGFNSDQVSDIARKTYHQTGKQYYSQSFRLLVDRFLVKIKSRENFVGVKRLIKESDSKLSLPNGELVIESELSPPDDFPTDQNIAWIDMDLVKWPLILRHWNPGDSFQPLGMGGHHKKLQDLFTDVKQSRFEKEATWILENDGQICWVVGMRMDERFKVRESTKRCLRMEYKPNSG